ncbi:penicillin acylase family protein [Flagellimonas lutaonensis]|uniref:Acyl-homoserine-lactone acylase n=1 Tax=Flagellimonas lutaonensis TaxID=516051 RepID=A0A0D5YW46_9FLAO|nr:penicillin acylase family protein [Allomuricauda lutaonensis]AKA36480.1 Acyl-homoserine-lactone acylase [Allomuricauda lutaonensis]
MKRLKKALLVLLVLLGVFLLAGGIFINSLTPTYEGEKELPQLKQPVEVYFDTYGVPHIYANNNEDAFRVLGYVHAQDRLWQMELLRRVAKGGLSEVFGPDLVKTDKFFLSLGIDEHTNETLANLDMDGEMVRLSQAYLDGINQFIDEGPTPVEFYFTGLDKTPFTLEDIYNSVGYMAFSFAMAHKTDPLLTNIKNKWGDAYLAELAVASDTATVWIKNYNPQKIDSVSLNITAMATEALEKLPLPQFEGSNSWVIAPEKTKNGKVIFANDPHIGFAQPSVWYEAHVSTPTYEKYGYHLAGVPFPLLGHNRQLAYGMTMFENDDIDFYYEENHPSDSTKYKTEKGFENYGFVTKTIKVKDGDKLSFSYKKTRHGPVLNGIADQVSGERPVAMSWIYTKVENQVLDALYGITMATDIEEFSQALPKIHAPGLNVMYGDAEGNVAWWAAAKLYEMPDSLSTKLILDGVSGKQEPLRYLDFSENPQAINPPWHYVYSANNQPDSIAGMLYPGYYLPENRAKRIVQLLEGKDDWDKEAVSEMILDVTSSVNPEIIGDLIKHMEVRELNENQVMLLDELKNWKGDYPLESIAGTFYHRSEYFVLKNTFEDELGPEQFKQFLSTHLLKRQIAPGARRDEGIWWDDVTTPDKKETRYEIVLKSFMQAWQSLQEDFGDDISQWQWQKVHTLEHGHPIGQVKALKSFFNVGPFPIHGSREVINNLGFPYDSTLYYRVSSGPSTRRIIDFSDIENGLSILPTGQSGNPLSKHYRDQAEMYVNGEFKKMMMNEEEIKEKSQHLLIFTPEK